MSSSTRTPAYITVRRVAAASLATGALVSAITLPASAADHSRHQRGQVEISAVQYDSPGRDNYSNRSLNREWVELTNTGRRTVNLDGWTLRNRDGETYTFDHFRLGGRATVRIHTGIGRDTRTDLFQDLRHYVWDNRSDTATLRNDHGRRVDSESWGHKRHGDKPRHGDQHRHGDRHRHGDKQHHGDTQHHGRYQHQR
ncbi:lamin tail domain-containing protein [Streptomyces sp. KAU_LT]|uniref:lamin tail domain-containing protein n=1 Tax=Streptomyces sp. KAU_LT TaxID=3046669 RepID=UPI0024B7CBF5|nr:lamin tail domain-containing protein [Streptomyces sp. KAU_LT]MDI9832890.1 lamin tail domain-containing protein [Streptomyces sp. KAU_LT]